MKILVVAFSLILLAFCLQSFRPDTISKTVQQDTIGQNPNGSSELAKLMREMQQYTKQAKLNLKEGRKPAIYPTNFAKLYTAKMTDDMTKSDFYNQFADLYIMSVKNYASSTPQQRIETYNNMVSACLACHSQHCQGPVPVIRKMMWEVK